MQLSPNFTLEELCASETADRLHIANTPDYYATKNLKILVTQILQPARDKLKRPLIISSGYRCKELNKAVGGVSNSYHLRGMAADIVCKDATEATATATALAAQQLTDEVIIESRGSKLWIHVQFSRNPRHLLLYDAK